MGCSSVEYNKNIYTNINECIVKNTTNYLLPEIIIEKLSEAIIRIEFEIKISTGFFLKINIKGNLYYFLVTCAHSITKEDINSKMTISIFYGKKETEKKMELDNNKRFIKCFIDDDIDATIIEILPEDNIPEEKYLCPDLNYKNGYEQYFGSNIFTAGYPSVDIYKGEKHFSGGEILGFRFINNNNNYNFLHSCSTKAGSSGSPLINYNQQVVGIHYGCNKKGTINHGVFIGAIIDNLNKENEDIKIKEKMMVKNDGNTFNKKEEINNDKNGRINNKEDKNKNINKEANGMNIKKDENINNNLRLNKNQIDIINNKKKIF